MELEWSDFLKWTRETQPGSVSEQTLTLENEVTVEIWDSGVMVAHPPKPGSKDIILSCAVHGDETAPIEMVRDIAHDIIAGDLVPAHRVMLLIANPDAINNGTRFVDENMNRLFSGAHANGNTAEHKRAQKLEYYVQRFYDEATGTKRQRFHYDLHTAIRDSMHEKFAVHPFTHGKPYKKNELSFLNHCGIEAVLLSQSATTTFSYFSAEQFEANAFTVELGKVKPFGENDMSRFASADKGLRELINQHDLQLPEFDANQLKIYEVTRVIDRQHEDFQLHFPTDVANFTPFEQGYVLATDGETEHCIETAGERIVFPNAKVKIGQRALLLVAEIPASRLKLV
ncbi:succinylglutamate desuccinylase [Pseudidiomarina planktonica]|uniref:Succinylglutamate desuccinylase n=1 Tax=Pseudidiomarina planktonica TaxID=1323738 RepID=A0A1Y6EV34_9GAMM|nr:succinylglutamate desuccinylase [Pseudidiomarina planktonica]RUO65079.1 succinylglutamate desuccinylase [Pseudidiomarina planktonica]SMQ66584.1 succinylglutamate desuccinylase [Pseudidiomarina planktonica]